MVFFFFSFFFKTRLFINNKTYLTEDSRISLVDLQLYKTNIGSNVLEMSARDGLV